MDITYFGHSCFKLKGKSVSVVCDPFDSGMVGLPMPKQTADIVTISHDHGDHNQVRAVSGTPRREHPYVIKAPGEYEIQGVGVFGWGTYHDEEKGGKRGKNTAYVIHIDSIRVGHLGDLGHDLSEDLIGDLGVIDVLLVPVGGVYTIGPSQAAEVVAKIQPSLVIPMHYKTEGHSQETFGEMSGYSEFLKAMEVADIAPVEKLKLTPADLPEETEVRVLSF